ncbi:MAG: rhomboid family intramembrane serine protease [Solirubrobacterales bacterium]|nr:rhomboid family intramembrane serine protease [Solirubrobacterales bacterium]
MSETELRVVCKSCGAEVSPYVTECPYCGARVRKRAPKLERRDGGLEPKLSRRERRRERQARAESEVDRRPLVTLAAIAIPAVALLARIAAGGELETFGAVGVPFESEWWRFITAPFAYLNLGYLFAVALALAVFGPGLERRLGRFATAVLLLACGSLGVLAAYGIADGRDAVEVIAGGNGMALGAIAAWWMIVRAEEGRDGYTEPIDVVGVLVSAGVILLLPVVVDLANPWSGLAGGAVGLLAGLAAAQLRR